ncbi:MAG: hypothetical protein KJ048_07325 [Dehalococcoidia bacterium]|nr:hypothetical protein [Dehalococcoidia bacterium]
MKLWRAIVLAVTLLIAAACDSGSGNQHDSVTRTLVEQLPEGVGVEDALRSASEYQREILADGVVTFEEYETSVLATVTCLRESGLEIRTGPELDASGRRYTYSYTGGGDAGRQSELFWGCYREYGDKVDTAWAYQTTPTEQERQAQRRFLTACLQDRGVAVPGAPESPNFSGIPAAYPSEFRVCSLRLATEHGVPEGFIP